MRRPFALALGACGGQRGGGRNHLEELAKLFRAASGWCHSAPPLHALTKLILSQDLGAPGPPTTLQERIQMWDDGNADRIGQLLGDKKPENPPAVACQSLGKMKRLISSAVNKMKGRKP